MNQVQKEWTFQSQTDIWTGDAGQKGERLILTGLLGSIRWWFEVAVRGLGGCACNPTGEAPCPDKDGRHCVVCELFGCTGWARKFRFAVLDADGTPKTTQIKSDCVFGVCYRRLKARLGPAQAAVATAHFIARGYDRMFTNTKRSVSL